MTSGSRIVPNGPQNIKAHTMGVSALRDRRQWRNCYKMFKTRPETNVSQLSGVDCIIRIHLNAKNAALYPL